MDAGSALVLCSLFAAVGTVIDVAEHLAARESNKRAFAWAVFETADPPRHYDMPSRVIGRVGLSAQLQIIRGLSAVAVPLLLLGRLPGVASVAALTTVIAHLVLYKRLVFGLDGADQMALIVWSGIVIAGVSPTAGLVLIAGQSILSYVTAGAAKLFGPDWRSGAAPRKIVETVGHGSAVPAKLLRDPQVSFLVSWCTIVFELFMPALVLLGTRGAAIFVATAALFHVSIAWAMGLNNFVWSFLAALPAVYFIAHQFN